VSAALDNKPHEMIKKNFVNYGLQLNKYSIFFFTTFVMNHTVETAANDLGRSGKYGFYIWNQSRILLHSTVTCMNRSPGN